MFVFLFTDIEGSTRLWENHPEEMKRALARHDSLLRKEIESRGGEVFKTVGDAFCAVFSSPAQACEAAIASQQAMRREAWGGLGAISIRVAVHAGSAEARDGDYFGSELNRVARLLGIARGGSILVSWPAAELVRSSLPLNAELKDLGEHYLKDVSEPVRVFHLTHPDLPSDFPLAKVADPSLNNLPSQLSSFVGRRKEIAEAKRFLSSSRLVTLVGSGGCGKTRLALEVGSHLVSAFQNGVWFADLASLFEPAFVAPAVAAALGLREDSGGALVSILADHLKGKRLLLILDNCEQVVETCANLSAKLLQFSPGLFILATSRQPLGVDGEVLYRIPSLSVPEEEHASGADDLSTYEAVQLFMDRARAGNPSLDPTKGSVQAVARICRQLDGIPLAIELAAARIRVMPPQQIAERLKDSFRFLGGGSKTALPRHQTLLATMEWSYNLLSEKEQILFRRLAVFAGGFTLDACEKICSGKGVEEWEVLDLLSALLDKSLVMSKGEGEEFRYHLLVSVREYALERLKTCGEFQEVRQAHLEYFLALAEKADQEILGPGAKAWVQRLDIEHENLRFALDWCRQEENRKPAGLQLSGALWKFWYRGHLSEGREWLEEFIAGVPEEKAHPLLLARALLGAGTIAWRQNDYAAVVSHCRRSLALFKASNHPAGIAYSLNSLGSVSNYRGDYEDAGRLFQESHEIFKQLQDPFGISLTLIELGMAANWKGEHDLAADLLAKGMKISDDLGNFWSRGFARAMLGYVQRNRGQGAKARELLEESLLIRREMQDRPGMAECLVLLGLVALDEAEPDEAEASFQEGLKHAQEVGWPWMSAFAVEGLGRVAFQKGDLENALNLHGQSLLERQTIGDKRGIAESLEGCARALASAVPATSAMALEAAAALRASVGAPVPPVEREACAKFVEALHERLGDAAWEKARNEGRALGWGKAVEIVLKPQA